MLDPDHLTDRPIAVIGGGTLGRRIALMFLTRGDTVRVFDTDPATRDAVREFVTAEMPAQLDRRRSADDAPQEVAEGTIQTPESMTAAVVDAWLVIEAVPEDPDLKREILGELDRTAPADAIIATNSSSYRSDLLIDRVSRPERVMNMHFQMPPEMNAVELMTSGRTPDALLDLAADRLRPYGLHPYIARRPSTGLIVNRVWAAVKRESLEVVAEGVAGPEDVDGLFREMFGTAIGPFAMMDRVGLDVVLDIEENYAAENPHLPEAPRTLLREYIDRGDLGEKTGKGFYDHR